MLFSFRSAEFKTDPLTKNSFNIHSFDDLDFISSTQVSHCSCCKYYCSTASAHPCASTHCGCCPGDPGVVTVSLAAAAQPHARLIVTFEPRHDVSERSD